MHCVGSLEKAVCSRETPFPFPCKITILPLLITINAPLPLFNTSYTSPTPASLPSKSDTKLQTLSLSLSNL